jgi:hypothetical protein
MPSATRANPSKFNRYYANLGISHYWMLFVEAWLKNRSLAEEAGSLLAAKLVQRTQDRDEMLNRIARRMGISYDELWDGIIDGTIAPDLTRVDPATVTPDENL